MCQYLQQLQNSEKTPSLSSKKRVRWTTEEHRSFLIGLEQCGKGDWINIARQFVKSKTPVQVASHAQKYFIRNSDITKEKKRRSIHDINFGKNDLISDPIQPSRETYQLNPLYDMPHEIPGFMLVNFNNGFQDQVPLILPDNVLELKDKLQTIDQDIDIPFCELCLVALRNCLDNLVPNRGSPSPNEAPSLQKKKYTYWTEDEHRAFLIGLEQCGKGDWNNIARQFVKSKTPTQVASHAQKYYIHQSASAEERKRYSIHDVTLEDRLGLSPQFS
ncbi:SANT/Myb domain [Sesbania bispinosa]|nr:SANT/Myb domain [Sesbania bispinosa]